jgi:serine/threonine protein phosphatase PrpC
MMVDEELFTSDHSISSDEEDMLVRSYSNLNVSFGYHRDSYQSLYPENDREHGVSLQRKFGTSTMMDSRNGSFTCLSGAAISANFTLANTNICKGLIGEEILPELDSPNSFRKVVSSPSMSRLDSLSNSLGSPESIPSTDSPIFEISKILWRYSTATTISSNFLTSTEVRMAGGAAGEDRVQAVCSEKNGWLICGIYDGFNGRDAADFLAVTLYDNIVYYLYLLECRIKQQNGLDKSFENSLNGVKSELTLAMRIAENEDIKCYETFRAGLLNCLAAAVEQAENDFLSMVEQDMDDRPDLVSVGSCVLVVLLHGTDLCILNLGDSRAVLASTSYAEKGTLKVTQLTEIHSLENPLEHRKLILNHPNDASVVMGNTIKGKLKVTRAFGVGYLKQVPCYFLIFEEKSCHSYSSN